MEKLKFVNCTLVLLSILLSISNKVFVKSDCNVCSAVNNRACISKTEYQECNDSNEPFGRIYQCNDGLFCSILGTCSSDADISDCNDCGKCNANQTIACLDTKTFALCLGTDKPSEITSRCSGELLCNFESDKICDTSPSTCSYRDDPTEEPTTTSTTSTTPSPATNPNGFCQAIKEEGRFPIGTNAETTCHQYVHCQMINGVWYGPIYNCRGNTYYDSTLRQCVTQIPSICSDTVVGLAFRNLILE